MQQLCAAAEVALAPILSNQTGNTIMHLMCHLREQAGREGTEPVSTAYRLLRLSCSSHACTEDNIAQAFLTLGAWAPQRACDCMCLCSTRRSRVPRLHVLRRRGRKWACVW
jgi:hypothetical protein